jgi:hypothetical protein
MWAAVEDHRLLTAIYKFRWYSRARWTTIASFVGNDRIQAQCSQRWVRVLKSYIKQLQWTEEDRPLLGFIAEFGQKLWMRIAVTINNWSEVQWRDQYHQIKRPRRPARAKPPSPDDLWIIRDLVELRPEHHHELPVPLISSLDPKQSSSSSWIHPPNRTKFSGFSEDIPSAHVETINMALGYGQFHVHHQSSSRNSLE